MEAVAKINAELREIRKELNKSVFNTENLNRSRSIR